MLGVAVNIHDITYPGGLTERIGSVEICVLLLLAETAMLCDILSLGVHALLIWGFGLGPKHFNFMLILDGFLQYFGDTRILQGFCTHFLTPRGQVPQVLAGDVMIHRFFFGGGPKTM